MAGNGIQGMSGDGGPATDAELNIPTGLAFDAEGSLYIADTYNNRIRKVTNVGPSLIKGLQPTSINYNVYPNPSSFKISLSGISKHDRLSMYDLWARKVYETTILTDEHEATIDISGLPDGNYELKIESATGLLVTQKIVKN